MYRKELREILYDLHTRFCVVSDFDKNEKCNIVKERIITDIINLFK